MKTVSSIILLISGIILASAARSAEAPLLGTRTTAGTWKPIAAVLGGVRLQKAQLDAITLQITGTNYEVTVTGEAPDRGTTVFDTTTNPKRMTIVSTNGPNRGKKFLAIYEMKDQNSLRVCYDLSGSDFPKEFAAAKGSKLYLVGYRRQTKE